MGKLCNRKNNIFFSGIIAMFIIVIAFFCTVTPVNAVAVGTTWDYEYTGEYQKFTAPESTWYKVELWGAMGGRGRTDWTIKMWGGGGAYTSGEIYLEKGTELYVYVGKDGIVGGTNSKCSGGRASWNGGGAGGNDSNCDSNPEPGGSGGGATDIRLVPTSSPDIWDEFDSLKSRIMVAAGGGGGGYSYHGSGGGRLSGISRVAGNNEISQTEGYAFGLGQTGAAGSDGKGGGGGGYYGGWSVGSGNGGSSFVSGCYGCIAIDEDSTSTNIIHTDSNVHYSGYKFDKIEMYAGVTDSQPYWEGGYQEGNYDWGHARITVAEHRSDNNYLKSLTTSNGTLSPAFDKTTETYDLVLDSNVSEVELKGIVDDAKSVVGGGTKYQVKYGEKTMADISVTNELGEVRVYKINISRKELASGEHSSKLADLSFKVFNEGAIVPKLKTDFDSDTYVYDMVVSSSVAALDFDAIPFDSSATIKKEGANKILGDSGTFKITVSASNCIDTVYLINYTRETTTKLQNEYTAIKAPQEFIAPVQGKYRIQLWGSQGMNPGTSIGGLGAYTQGDIILDAGEKLYVYVGDSDDGDAYNGGGTAPYNKTNRGFGGGGATDVRLVGGDWNNFESLKSRIMVAAGGGGGYRWTNWGTTDGGNAGGLYSYSIPQIEKNTSEYQLPNTGATQTSPGFEFTGQRQMWSGYRGSFGIGGDASSTSGGAGAGGGGYFGGGGGGSGTQLITSGSGGSSYISGHTGCNSISEHSSQDFIFNSGSKIHYSNKYFTNTVMIDGLGYNWVDENGPKYHDHDGKGWNVELDDGYYTGQPTNDGTGIQEGQSGNGYAKIELLNDSNNNYLADLTSNYGKFSKDFDPFDDKITLNLDKYEQHFTLEGVLADKTSTVTGLGQYRVGLGETKVINIAVTSANGETRLYEVTATRGDFAPGEHSTQLEELNINQGSYSLKPEFISIETNYEIDAPYSSIALDVDAIPYDSTATVKVEGNGYLNGDKNTIKITITHPDVETTVYEIKVNKEENIEGKKVQYDCTEEEQEFIAPASTYYRIQLWGAAGGYGRTDWALRYRGGLGAYTDGEIYLNKGQKLYVYVGCMGRNASSAYRFVGGIGGFNGGGKGGNDTNQDSAPEPGGGGGGATDVRLVPTSNKVDYWEFPSLKSRIMVAAGGGGGNYGGIGGAGGALTGLQGYGSKKLASQTDGWYFGYGRTGANGTSGAGGGGGGYYGGLSNGGGGGGSSFVSGCDGCLAIEQSSPDEDNITHKTDGVHYSGLVFDKIAMLTGNDNQPSITDGYQTGNWDDGHAIITAAKPRSENNFLSEITVDKGTLTPDYDILTRDYEVKVTPDDDTITIDAKLDDEKATMTGTGEFDVPAGKTEFPITVTAENGSIRIYTVTVERDKSDNPYPVDISIKGLVPTLCNVNASYCHLTPGFNPDTNSYSIKVPSRQETVELVVTKGHKYQTVIGDGQVKLERGLNTFTIEVISEDEQKVSTYTISIDRDMSGDANISNLEVLDPPTDIHFDPDTTEYTFSVPNSYTNVTLKVELQDDKSTYKVVGNENFVTGLNLVQIEVTAQNGDTKTYTLKVYREQSGNTFIDEIRVENNNIVQPLVPTYQKTIHDYVVYVGNEVDTVDIIATPEHTLTTIKGDGTKTLQTGVNKFELTSTSEDGSTQIYTVSVIRSKSNDATLKSLDVLEGTLSPDFQSNILEYDIEVSPEIDSLTLNPVLNDAAAKYRVTGNSSFVVGKNVVYITVTAEDGTRNTYVINVNKKASSNNYLSNLKVGKYSLDPAFDREQETYEVEVDRNITQVVVSATPEDSKAKVSNTGTYNLSSGKNTITIVVTAEDGSDRTYTVTVTREMSSDSTLDSLTTSSQNSYTPAFSPATTQYELEVEREEDRITVVGVSSDPYAKVTGNATYALKVGANTIDIKVKAEDGSETVYTLVVKRKASDNANIALLIAKESVLDPAFEKNTLNYELRVLESVTSLTLYVNLEDANATYEVIGNENFEIGHNTVTIKVAAENGVTTQEYELDVLRQEAGTASNRLEKLEVNQGTLDPTFDPDTNYYEVEVGNEIDNIAIDGELEDKNATVTGFGNYPLEVGKNTLSVKVTSTENIVRYYQVIVTRKGKEEARLSSLSVNNHTITPIFDKDTYEYTMTTEDTLLTIEAIPIDTNAKVQITGDTNLQIGQNEVLIKVTAEDGVTTKEYKIHVEREKSKNNNLKLLEVSDVTLDPTFASSTTVYLGEVDSSVMNVVITALPEDSKATVSGDGAVNLAIGANYIDITVTSEAGTDKVYTLVITRVGSSDNDLTALYTSEGTLTPKFNKTVHDYTVTVPYEVNNIVVSGTLSDINASVVGFDRYDLEVGDTPIKIIVTAEDGTVNFYNIIVTRENIVSSLLEDVSIKNYKMDQTFASELFDYTVTVDYEVTELEFLTIKTLDKNATYVVNGNSNFNVGMNTVEIVVTDSLGGDTSTYTINVNRQNYSNTYLSYIYTDKGDLDPDFTKENLSYTVEVDSDVDTINVMAVAEVTTNTVEGVGPHSLNPGSNVIAVSVTTPTGIKRIYYVDVIRKQDNSNDLTSLRIKANDEEQTLNPAFDKDELNYTVTVPPSTPSVEILATTTNKASISGIGVRPLQVGDNVFNVTVTSESGATKVYVITVHRDVSDNNYLSSLVPSAGTLDPTFHEQQQEYELVVDSNTTTLSFTAKPKDQFATVSGAEIAVVDKDELIREIVVTAENGDTRSYKVKVIRERSDETRLKELKISNYPFEETFDKDTFTYTVTLPKGKTELTKDDVIATPIDSKATVEKQEKLELSTEQDNIYTVVVTARDGFTKQTYTIKVNLVEDIDITDIILDDEVVLGVGEEFELQPTFEPTDATNKEIEYISNDTDIATVENGKITGVKEGETTIVVSSKKAPTITKEVKVKVINLKISSQVYEVRRDEVNLFDANEIKDIIIGADKGEALTDFIGKLDNDASLLKVYDRQNQEITDLDNNVVTTGYKVTLEFNNKIYDSVYVVVRGDNTQDGAIDADDNALLKSQILSKIKYDADTLVFKATDVVETQVIDADDMAKLNRYILGKEKSLN